MRPRDASNPPLLGRLGMAVWARKHPEWAKQRDHRVMPVYHLSLRTTPRYLRDRLRVKRNAVADGVPQPWITAESRQLLAERLQPIHRGLEYGAGGTTSFFAPRVEHLYSVEGFDHWYEPLAKRLADLGVSNVSLTLASAEELGYESEAHRDAYVNAHPELAPGSLDFVFVDGEYRDDCMMRAIELLKPGGLLILDNAEIYLPSTTRSPWQMPAPATPLWERFLQETVDWGTLWTTNGVWDTAFWFKP